MANCMKLYDVVRIDHFRGFDEYYSIPYGDKTAEFGHWEKGPGIDLFRTLEKNLGKLDVIAEDLGLLTDSVIEMVEESGFPGMKVLQFAFDENEDSPYLTHRYERNCIVYTGTHDNETTRGWFRNLSQHDRNFAKAYIGCEGKHETAAVWSLIRAAMSSVADRCVIPVQDYLCLGNEARKIRKSCSRRLRKKRIPIREILPQEAAFCGSSQGVILCIRDIVSAPML